jgi:hypothetical protein
MPVLASNRPSYVWVRFVFLRGLALIYLIAFGSFWMQMDGLIGSHGIVPAQGVMTALKEGSGAGAYWPGAISSGADFRLVERERPGAPLAMRPGRGLRAGFAGGIAPR